MRMRNIVRVDINERYWSQKAGTVPWVKCTTLQKIRSLLPSLAHLLPSLLSLNFPAWHSCYYIQANHTHTLPPNTRAVWQCSKQCVLSKLHHWATDIFQTTSTYIRTYAERRRGNQFIIHTCGSVTNLHTHSTQWSAPTHTPAGRAGHHQTL